jgi:hypothetical protein
LLGGGLAAAAAMRRLTGTRLKQLLKR